MTEEEERRFSPTQFFSRTFTDSESLAASIPGGKVDVVPTGYRDFRGTVRLVNLGKGVSLQSAGATAPVTLRTELIGGDTPATTFFFVPNPDPKAAVDGIHLAADMVFSRSCGDISSLRTAGPFELRAVCILNSALRRASAALTGREKMAALETPATLKRAGVAQLANLHSHYALITQAVDAAGWEMIARRKALTEFASDAISAALVRLLDTGDLRTDHLAHRLQTASMRRIDRLIDEDSDHLIGLQELCERAGLSLRTIESIIRRRMDMTAHSYLKRRRLTRARKALLSPGEGVTVTSVAMDHGFTHLGRFSIFYRQMYGESPSETLRNVTGRQEG
ncbi:helix-turn-helix domain-containing protein [Paracoccus sp. TOH]|uniref:helix-turn-helix domain-containing protein n=1 Tax=Paracoccus sp. TOH TaxID=1263728 RepID=UPI0002F4ACC9|nr:helix-turn-helix domain-containing protein [Paracoccus sp. TOH]WJS85369.1 helix-turn-helix domain-containing protein [Paracoccus sp. TOH]